jgi:hypothetical protein
MTDPVETLNQMFRWARDDTHTERRWTDETIEKTSRALIAQIRPMIQTPVEAAKTLIEADDAGKISLPFSCRSDLERVAQGLGPVTKPIWTGTP